MNKLLISFIAILFIYGCGKEEDEYFEAQIVAFDNCLHNPMLSFPKDLTRIKDEFGSSKNNLYKGMNMPLISLEMNQHIMVRIKGEADGIHLSVCEEEYPRELYKHLNIMDYKVIK